YIGNKTKYSTCTLRNECGVRKNQMGAASNRKKNSATKIAGKIRNRSGEARIKRMNAASSDRATTNVTPSQPAVNHPRPSAAADRSRHQTQISESINGSLTKRKKYSPLRNLPMDVISGSFKCASNPTT